MKKTAKERGQAARKKEKAEDLIQRQLEFLKYQGGHDELGRPSGQGVNLEIALLPDLLIDFHQHKLGEESDASEGGRDVCAIGGRASRLACTLLNLLSDDDDTFRVYLLAKTGVLGTVMLAEEFRGTDSERSAGLCFETVTVRDGEPRCAFLAEIGKGIVSGKADPNDELCGDDLGQPLLRTLLERVTSVYLSSITTPNFDSILGRLLSLISPCQQYMFVDTTRGSKTSQEHVEHLVRRLTSDAKNGTPIVTQLFVPTHMQKPLFEHAEVSSGRGLSEKCAVGVIQYGDGSAEFSPADGSEPSRTSAKTVNFSADGIPERFKAGVLLASTLYRQVLLCAEKEATMKRTRETAGRAGILDSTETESTPFAIMAGEWPSEEKDAWRLILEYGMRVASADLEPARQYASLSSVLKECPDHNCCTRASVEGRKVKAFRNHEGFQSRVVNLQSDTMRYVARLAGLRRNRKLGKPNLARCRDAHCKECPAGTESDKFSAAIMIDLDGTLVDSTAQRNRGVAAALKMLEDVADWPPEYDLPGKIASSVQFFDEYVYGRWRFFKHCGFGDFRQEWNHPGWYTMYVLLAKYRKWYERIREIRKDRDPDRPDEEPNWINELREEYKRVGRDCKVAIDRAQDVFADCPMVAFKEARDFLASLEQCGFRLYIVSEGQPNAQWAKIQKTGLDKYFGRSRVLTTGDAASPEDEIRALDHEETKLRRTRKWYRRRRRTYRMQSDVISRLRLKVSRDNEEAEQAIHAELNRLQCKSKSVESRLREVEQYLKLARFARMVLKRMSAKSGTPFYAAVIRAILRDPDNPLSILTSFRRLMEPLHVSRRASRRIKFAMIGDRARNDISPPTELLGPGNLLTIRLISGKYHTEPGGAIGPTFVADTLAQAKMILLQDEAWYHDEETRIHCADDPSVFNWVVHTVEREHFPPRESDGGVGLNWINRGLEMPEDEYRVIPEICAGLLDEYLRRYSQEADNILPEYVDRDDTTLGGTRSRLRRLCRLARTGILEAEHTRKYSPEFVRVIFRDVAQLTRDTDREDSDLRTGRESLEYLASGNHSRHTKNAAKEALNVIKNWGWRWTDASNG